MPAVDYYKILQVVPDAEPEVIEAAYKRLAFKYHPDRNRDFTAANVMRDLNEAYEVLQNPQKRQLYDLQRKSQSTDRENCANQDKPNKPSDNETVVKRASRIFRESIEKLIKSVCLFAIVFVLSSIIMRVTYEIVTSGDRRREAEQEDARYQTRSANNAIYEAGWRHFHARDFKEAEECFTILIEKRWRLSEAHFARGYVFQSLGHDTKAIENYNDAIRENDYNAAAFNNRGSIFQKQLFYKEALRDYDRAIRLDPGTSLYQNNRDILLKLMNASR